MLNVFPQSSGEQGVLETLQKMVTLTNRSVLDPVIRDQAALAISGCPRGFKACQAQAILQWAHRKVRYVADPASYELLHDPRLMARCVAMGKFVYGDCDDLSMYMAAMLKSVGLHPVFRAVGYNNRPFSHVYVVCEGMKLDAARDLWNPGLNLHVETSAMEEPV